jgi:hypothetical protein
VTNLKLTPRTFRRGKHAATLAKSKAKAKTAPTATTISFTLSEAARVSLSLQAVLSGVRSGRKCLATSKAPRKGHRRCTVHKAIHGGVALSGHAGLDRVHFEGVLDGGKRLAPGVYRLSLRASAPAGSTTATEHPAFQLKP